MFAQESESVRSSNI